MLRRVASLNADCATNATRSRQNNLGIADMVTNVRGKGEQHTIRVVCHYKASTDWYEADIAPDLSCNELIAGLLRERYLDDPQPGERYQVLLLRNERELLPHEALNRAGVEDGDALEIFLESHGAGPVPEMVEDLAAVLAAAKIAIDAAKVVVDAYRAKTERVAAETARAELEARERQEGGGRGEQHDDAV